MKRSQMLELIAEELLKLHGGDSDEWEEVREQTKMARLKAANYSLSAAEKAGMLPPCTAGYGGHGKLGPNNSCDDYVESCDFRWDCEASATGE